MEDESGVENRDLESRELKWEAGVESWELGAGKVKIRLGRFKARIWNRVLQNCYRGVLFRTCRALIGACRRALKFNTSFDNARQVRKRTPSGSNSAAPSSNFSLRTSQV